MSFEIFSLGASLQKEKRLIYVTRLFYNDNEKLYKGGWHENAVHKGDILSCSANSSHGM